MCSILTGCLYKGDCTHKFEYHGKIKASNNTLKDSLIIRFNNLGDIIFKTPKKENRERSTIDNKGQYKVKGDFFTACASDENIFNEIDSLSFEIIIDGQISKTGTFSLKDLNKKYTDSIYLTTIILPEIQIE